MARNTPSSGEIIGGILLLLFGACFLLVGGCCAAFWIVVLLDASSWGHESGPGLMLLCLAAAVIGAFAIVKGVRLLRGPRDRGDRSA